jgi:hypothetical protein
MKLRIRANSLRLRLGQSEVRRLVEEGLVEEQAQFGQGSAFVYAVRTGEATSLTATFVGGRIVVTVPRAEVRRWAGGGQVGMEGAQPTGDGESLRILIEKDFECLDAPPGESQEDAFPRPRGANC